MPFDVTDPQGIQALSLQLFYEDGFVAYLNGKEVLRSYTMGGASGVPPAYNVTCSNRSPEPGSYDPISSGPVPVRYGSGTTEILAYTGMNTLMQGLLMQYHISCISEGSWGLNCAAMAETVLLLQMVLKFGFPWAVSYMVVPS